MSSFVAHADKFLQLPDLHMAFFVHCPCLLNLMLSDKVSGAVLRERNVAQLLAP